MFKELYKSNKRTIKKTFYILFITAVLAVLLAPMAWYYDFSIRARSILMDAKNIQLSMRLLNIQYYGVDRVIYQPGTKSRNGYGYIEDVKHLSNTDGEIILIYWDYEDNVPGKFYYKTEDFLAIYEYDTIRKEPTWEVLRLNEIINYGMD